MPVIIKTWLELVEPHKPAVVWWEPLDVLDEPDYVKVRLDSGHEVIIKREGSDIKTWRFKK